MHAPAAGCTACSACMWSRDGQVQGLVASKHAQKKANPAWHAHPPPARPALPRPTAPLPPCPLSLRFCVLVGHRQLGALIVPDWEAVEGVLSSSDASTSGSKDGGRGGLGVWHATAQSHHITRIERPRSQQDSWGGQWAGLASHCAGCGWHAIQGSYAAPPLECWPAPRGISRPFPIPPARLPRCAARQRAPALPTATAAAGAPRRCGRWCRRR